MGNELSKREVNIPDIPEQGAPRVEIPVFANKKVENIRLEKSTEFADTLSHIRPFFSSVDNPLGFQYYVTKMEELSLGASTEIKIHDNPFYRGALLAFNHHYKYVISPEIFWNQVLRGLAIHVQLNEKTFAGKFFDKNIDTRVFTFKRLEDEGYEPVLQFLDGCAYQIFEKTCAKKLIEILQRPFSTTSNTAHVVFKLGIMDIVQNYATYNNFTSCGIPSFIVLGTKEDWLDFADRLDIIKDELLMGWWTELLKPVILRIAETVEAINHNKSFNREFWENFIKFKSESGGKYINGWINLLKPYIFAGSGLDDLIDWMKDKSVTDTPICDPSIDYRDPNYGGYVRIDLYIAYFEKILKPCYSSYKIYRAGEKNEIVYFTHNLEYTSKDPGVGRFIYKHNDSKGEFTRKVTYGVIGLMVNTEGDTIMPALGFYVQD